MKRFSKVLTYAFLFLLLTGCVRHKMHMNISKSGEIEVSSIIAYQSSAGKTVTDSDKEKYKANGFKVEDYTDEDYKGVKLTKKFKISEISSNNEVVFSLTDLYETKNPKVFQKVGKNRYKANLTLDTRTDDGQSGSGVDISYSVTLPTKAISHNAEKEEDNTLTWTANLGEVKSINYEFEVSGSSSLWIIIAIVAVAAAAIVVVIVVMNKKNKNNETNSMNGAMPLNQNPEQPVTSGQVPSMTEMSVAPMETPIMVENAGTSESTSVETVAEPVTTESVVTPEAEETSVTGEKQSTDM